MFMTTVIWSSRDSKTTSLRPVLQIRILPVRSKTRIMTRRERPANYLHLHDHVDSSRQTGFVFEDYYTLANRAQV
jgi:hypothetical protein